MDLLREVAAPQGFVVAGTLLVTLITWAYNLRRQRRDGAREHFAKALAAIESYKEFPFAIARRRHDQPEAERVRLSEAIREVQRDLSFYCAWLTVESPIVAAKFDAYVTQTRRVAGGAMHDAWSAPAITSDHEMNVPSIAARLAELDEHRQAYLQAVWQHEHPVLRRVPWVRGPHPSA